MIPAAFVVLEALPLTPNGKVDRHALPAPDPTRSELEGVLVAPRTHVEAVLAGIWAEVLGLEYVGVHDNFFDVGGHSLTATQVMARVRNALRVELPLRSLFAAPSVAELAVTVIQSQSQEEDDEYLSQMLEELDRLPEDEVREKLKARGINDRYLF
jgi:acyl carrier protein